MTKPIPDGYHTVTPYLTIKDAVKALPFYEKAFGAKVLFKMQAPDGHLAHAELQIGDSRVMLGEESPAMKCFSPKSLKGTPVGLYLYVENVDAFFDRAVKAGARVDRPLEDMFYGDRVGTLEDPFGHKWSIGTHKEDVPPKELEARAKKAFATAHK